MARGGFLPAVRFDTNLRKQLAGYLCGHDAPAIIADLEGVVQVLPAFRRTRRRQSIGATLRKLKAATVQLRELLNQLADDEDIDNYLWNSLALGRWDPGTFRARLMEGLDAFSDVIDRALELQQPRARGGAPRDLEAAWLVEQVTDTLKRHNVNVTSHESGVWANVLRALWPSTLRRASGKDGHIVRRDPNLEAPYELKPWFKNLKRQR
jgi:hypothetical protein